MGIETICEGGRGSVATVFVQLRRHFPGFGGLVKTEQDFVTACRMPNDSELDETENEDAFSYEGIRAREAFNVFLRHAVVKKFDDYFFRKQFYRYAHIPRPLGSDSKGAYFYEWVYGTEGFHDEYRDMETGRMMGVEVDEWNAAGKYFGSAGIMIFDDIADPDDGHSIKNIIIQEPSISSFPIHITKLWKRIDFGSESMKIYWDKVADFIRTNEEDMNIFLRPKRVNMMRLITEYFMLTETSKKFRRYDELANEIYSFRKITAEHMGVQDTSPLPVLVENSRIAEILSDEAVKRDNKSFTKRMKAGKGFIEDMEIRDGHRCIDGTIFTLQEVPVARHTLLIQPDDRSTTADALDHKTTADANYSSFHDEEIIPHFGKDDTGFILFLRHFLAKKLENAFIKSKKYRFAHIARPLGSDGSSCFSQWIYGSARCPKGLTDKEEPSSKTEGLNDWPEFISYFKDAGIDFKSGLKYAKKKGDRTGTEYAEQIIVRQPYTDREEIYISRMWTRIYFDEDNTPFDLDRLKNYLTDNETILRKNLTQNRYETMVLAVKYLKQTKTDKETRKQIEIDNMTEEELDNLKEGIHSYRVSALRHLNHIGFEPPPKGLMDLVVKNK
ncbi:MAG: hypothetical protein ABIG89_07335 [Candidatus Woesearchaeota archaeon]